MIKIKPDSSAKRACIAKVALSIDAIAPVVESFNELLLLPDSLHWIGKASFSLGQVSVFDGQQVSLRRSFVAHISADQADQEALNAKLPQIRRDIKLWLHMHKVACTELTDGAADQNIALQGDVHFLCKTPPRRPSGYHSFLMPLSPQTVFDVAPAEKKLLANPDTGLLIQIMPDEWTEAEKSIISRYSVSAQVDQAQVEELLAANIACFNIACWGHGASLAAQALIGGLQSELSESRTMKAQDLPASPLDDPWAVHQHLHRPQRMEGVFSAREVAQAFRCRPLKIGEVRIVHEGNVDLTDFKQHLEAAIHDLGNRIHSIDGLVDDLSTRVHTQETRTDDLTSRVGTQETRADELIGRVNNQEARANDLASRVGAQEARTDELTSRVGAQEARIDAQEGRANELARRADEQEKRASGLASRVGAQENRVNKLSAEMAQVNQRLQAMENRVLDLAQSFSLSKKEIDNLRTVLNQFSENEQKTKEDLLQLIHELKEKDPAVCRDMVRKTASFVDGPLPDKILQAIGVKSEDELLRLGMTPLHQKLLRYSAASLEDDSLLGAAAPRNSQKNYFCDVVCFCILFERITRDNFHDTIYVPYFRRVEQSEPLKPEATNLSDYSLTPRITGRNIHEEEWTKPAKSNFLAKHAFFEEKTWTPQQWALYFTDMDELRKRRNGIHSSFISSLDAFFLVRRMLFSTPTSPCYILRTLEIGHCNLK